MGKRSREIDAYIAKSQPFAQPILEHLRELVHEVCPEVEERIKWSHPAFEYKGPFAMMASFKAHATFGLWKHSLLVGTDSKLAAASEQAMGSFGRLTSLADLPSRRTLVSLLRKAMKLNEDGIKQPTRAAAKKQIVVRPPADFLTALRRNKKALATYQALPPGAKRDYVEWVTEAKTQATRERRLSTAVAWMAEGKRRNWKYERR
jgi:uncharacterized protein YdeI (YjbR/CyaY-like superfamily)